METSIPYSLAGFKREMRFLELCEGGGDRCSRLCAAKMAAPHAAVAGRPTYRLLLLVLCAVRHLSQ